MNLANQSESDGANTRGIFSDLPSETPEAEPDAQPEQTAQPEEEAKTVIAGEETQSSDTKPQSRRVRAKLNDQDVELDVVTEGVDLDLIPKGLMMEKDYRKKTAEVSERNKALNERETKIDSALTELYDQIEFQTNELNSKESLELKELDPDEFEKKRLDVERKVSLFKRYREQRDGQLAESQKEVVSNEVKKLPEIIPEWMDDKVMREDTYKISAMLKNTYGYDDKQISGIYDSKVISMLRKAALFDEIQNASLESNKKVSKLKSSKPNSTAESKPVEEPSIESIFYGN